MVLVRKIICTPFVILLLFASFLFHETKAQKVMEKIARAGGEGIYIYNAFSLSSANWPDKEGGVKITIQRRDNGQGAWKNIASFEPPNSLFDLVSKYKTWSPYVLDNSFLNPGSIAECWNKLQLYKSYDSTNIYNADQVMMFAIGRMYLDTTVVKNQKYEYQFSRINASGVPTVIGQSTPVNYPEKNLLSKPKYLKKEAEQDRVKVTWYLKKSKKPAFFKVFRRTAGVGTTWENITAVRTIQLLKPDTIALVMFDWEVSPNQNYDYYIRLSDSYGNYASNSDTVSVVSYKYQDISMPYRFRTISLDSLQTIQLRWNVKDKALMSGLEVYKSSDYENDYKLVGRVSIGDTIYNDRDVEPMKTYYYYLRAVDQMGRQSVKSARAYGNLTDKTKPMSPKRVKVAQVKEGIKISWEKQGLFVEDFYVHRCIGIEGKMQKISTLIHNKDSICSYIDTASRLNAKFQYGYAVTQVTTSHQESDLSKIEYIQPENKRKVLVPLTAPNNLTAQKVGENLVMLFWDNVSTMNIEVDGYNVYKQTGAKSEFIKVNKTLISVSQNHFKDSTYSKAQSSTYYIKSVNTSGSIVSKPSNIVSLQTSKDNLIAPVNVKLFQMMEEKNVQITWSNTSSANAKSQKIYRAEQNVDKVAKLVSSLEPTKDSYVDKSVQVGKSYFYYLTTAAEDGQESEKSEVVFIQMINSQ